MFCFPRTKFGGGHIFDTPYDAPPVQGDLAKIQKTSSFNSRTVAGEDCLSQFTREDDFLLFSTANGLTSSLNKLAETQFSRTPQAASFVTVLLFH